MEEAGLRTTGFNSKGDIRVLGREGLHRLREIRLFSVSEVLRLVNILIPLKGPGRFSDAALTGSMGDEATSRMA